MGCRERLALLGSTILVAVFTFLLWKIIYNVFLHPLARFPGPLINKISWLPTVMWTLRGRMPMETRRLHNKYGPVVRLSPKELSFNTLQAWNDIYSHRAGREDLNKHPIHVGSVDPVPGVSTISMADNRTHARQRKALSHCFSKQALWSQESIIKGSIDILMNKLKASAETGESINIMNWYNFLTFDVIGELAFGESFDCLGKGEFNWWIEMIFNAVKAGAIEQATRRFATAGSATQQWLMKMWIPAEIRKQRASHLAYSREKVISRIQRKTERKDFIYHILKQSDHYDLQPDEVVVNAALFIVAGSETTASELGATTNFLLQNPQCWKKLQQEVRSKFANEEEITLKAVMELPYLNACIEEGLRVFPPAPIGFLRQIQDGGDVIDGYFVPGGTAVSVSSWCAHHSAENFRNPDSYIPERWISDEYKDDLKGASRPFSLRPRGCIGKDLSWAEMKLTIARLAFNFEIERADSGEQWNSDGDFRHLRAYSTWQKPELNVRLMLNKIT
ncbi:hypothetical protein M433DRAFT_75432 [Acidomyces richmondensis BFW]|nr:hypothetical protein M433DRAFT_75432 [Acidomyces richmondensis BFW]